MVPGQKSLSRFVTKTERHPWISYLVWECRYTAAQIDRESARIWKTKNGMNRADIQGLNWTSTSRFILKQPAWFPAERLK
jgi:hypothetical protein